MRTPPAGPPRPLGGLDPRRPAGWLLLLLLALLVAAPATAKKRRQRRRPPRAKVLVQKPSGQIGLHLEAVDYGSAQAVVIVSGISREPGARLFTLHDDRGRHVIVMNSRCAATPEQLVRCELELPRQYLQARIERLTITVRGQVHGVPAEEMVRFDEARARSGVPPARLPPPLPKGQAVPPVPVDGGGGKLPEE